MEFRADIKLVTVCVVTFNSGKTVIETLNSIYNQSYERIELIVSDDASKDNTLKIIKEWVNSFGNRFEKVEIINSEVNTGVTKNINRACRCANGEYVKIIAGDDLLKPVYLSHCINYLENNIDVNLLLTKIDFIGEDSCKTKSEKNIDYSLYNKSCNDQLNYFIRNGIPFIPTASAIYRKTILLKMNYFDERIPMWEDGPMYFRLTKAGEKLFLLEENLVQYRVSSSSISHAMSINSRKSCALFMFHYQIKEEFKFNIFKAMAHIITSFLWYNSDKKWAIIILKIIHKRK